MVRVGLVTSVIIRVGSVTSTCLWSSAGDMRNRSAPMSPLSSGTLPGQISTTRGSAASADHAKIQEARPTAADAKRFMVHFLRPETGRLSGFTLQLAAYLNLNVTNIDFHKVTFPEWP